MKHTILTLKLLAVISICMVWVEQSSADDTEIYQAKAAATSNGRPKVLIIFDNSGSMSTLVTQQVGSYDPSTTYSCPSTSTCFNANRIYIENNDTSAYFQASANRCSESYDSLDSVGFFQGRVQRSYYDYNSSSEDEYEWRDLGDNNGTRTATHVDCEADFLADIADNGSGTSPGYPCENNISTPGDVSNYYCSAKESISWGSTQTLYTGNYLNWYNGEGTETRERLEIAKDTVNAIIDANPSIDFGLMTFNYNSGSSNDGARIINRIVEDSSDSYRNNIKSNINSLDHAGWTPLCESAYEAYRYLTGSEVYYGLERDSTRDALLRDTAAETAGKYISPTSDCAYTYVILMTDGVPVRDTDADANVEALTGQSCNGSCLDEIAEYMANNDLDGDTTNGDQFAITYTIGFATDQQLLEDTASKGKGQYYTADSATELAAAFQSAITQIIGTTQSFTSPAVAVDTFSRTESRNEVFFAMFEPSDRVNWKGNIKRLNLVINDGVAELRDANNEYAFDSDGFIAADAQTVWSSDADGDAVDQGGVGELLALRDPSDRKIYINTGTNNALEELNFENLDAAAFGESDMSGVYSLYGVNDETAFKSTISWAMGYDKDDEDEDLKTDEPRPWVLGDMLHSRPIVINYGALGSKTEASPEQRLLVGTNSGFFHMFDVDDGSETWAFTPKELAGIHKQRRDNIASTNHVYGIDGAPSIYTDDGGDGTIDATSGDKAYVYFGMRRGGRNYYALDVSDPDSPSYLWQISGGSGDFAELGQTWSIPQITKIPGYKYDHDNDSDTPDIPKPVLIFGAGYDTNKDDSGVATADSVGRGIFIVDAFTGELVWSITPGANSDSNLQALIFHSVPSNIAMVDSNADELTDRMYFGDTGGNLWRVDMPGDKLPSAQVSGDPQWRITLFADMNEGATDTDRRFFNSPDVVRTKQQICVEFYEDPANVCKVLTTVNFDAVLIGTGDRTNPNATDVNNAFYMFRDEQITPFTDAPMTVSECTEAASNENIKQDFRCNLPFAPSDLYDATSNILQGGNPTAESSLQNAHGWRINFSNTGEKSLARSLTLFGSVFFTTFAPDNGLLTSCEPTPGKGRLYQVNILNATAVTDFNNDGTLDRSNELGSLIPDTPSPHFGSDKKIRLLFPSGGGDYSGLPLDSGAQLPQPYGIYWYREEL